MARSQAKKNDKTYALVLLPNEGNIRKTIKSDRIKNFEKWNPHNISKGHVYHYTECGKTTKCLILKAAGTKEELEKNDKRIPIPTIVNPSSLESSNDDNSTVKSLIDFKKQKRKKLQQNQISVKSHRSDEIIKAYKMARQDDNKLVEKKNSATNGEKILARPLVCDSTDDKRVMSSRKFNNNNEKIVGNKGLNRTAPKTKIFSKEKPEIELNSTFNPEFDEFASQFNPGTASMSLPPYNVPLSPEVIIEQHGQLSSSEGNIFDSGYPYSSSKSQHIHQLSTPSSPKDLSELLLNPNYRFNEPIVDNLSDFDVSSDNDDNDDEEEEEEEERPKKIDVEKVKRKKGQIGINPKKRITQVDFDESDSDNTGGQVDSSRNQKPVKKNLVIAETDSEEDMFFGMDEEQYLEPESIVQRNAEGKETENIVKETALPNEGSGINHNSNSNTNKKALKKGSANNPPSRHRNLIRDDTDFGSNQLVGQLVKANRLKDEEITRLKRQLQDYRLTIARYEKHRPQQQLYQAPPPPPPPPPQQEQQQQQRYDPLFYLNNDQFDVGDDIYIPSGVFQDAFDASEPAKFIMLMANSIWGTKKLARRVVRMQKNTRDRRVLTPRKVELLKIHYKKYLEKRDFPKILADVHTKNINTFLDRAIQSAKRRLQL